MDTQIRTIVKLISFKLLTTSVTYAITGDLKGAIIIHLAMTACFWVHERLWNIVKWGRAENKPTLWDNQNKEGVVSVPAVSASRSAMPLTAQELSSMDNRYFRASRPSVKLADLSQN